MNKKGTDKIVFLGLFVLSLLLARLIVATKTAIRLTGPIELEHTGLSIAFPRGGLWQSQKHWSYEQNCFNINCFASANGDITTLIGFKYSLAPIKSPPQQWVEDKEALLAAGVQQQGVMESPQPSGLLYMHWAHLARPKELLDFFIATCELPLGRRLELEIHQFNGDAELAEKIFNSVLQSITLIDNEPFDGGADIVGQIKDAGLGRLLEHNRTDFFIIENLVKQQIGFAVEVQAINPETPAAEDSNGFNIHTAGFYYIRDRFVRQRISLFKTNRNLEKFIWKSETSDITGPKGIEIALEQTGILTVGKPADNNKAQKYQPSPAAIPDALLEAVIRQLLESDYERIIVDIISPDGGIMPTIISKIKTGQPDSSEIAYVLLLKAVHKSGFTRQIYLDDKKQILKMLVQRENSYLLKRTTKEDVLEKFPERAEYILQDETKLPLE